MIADSNFQIPELNLMKKYPKDLRYIGNLNLLNKRKISIVGSRRPLAYTKQMTLKLAQELSHRDVCIVSGAAMGVDALAHQGARSSHTIAVMPTGLSLRYPSVNANLIKEIEQKGLCISQFEDSQTAKAWSFIQRNELVVALGESLIVTQADKNSGSMRSVAFALEMGKKVYVLPHRIKDSEGTNELLEKNLATCIYDINLFVEEFGGKSSKNDEFLTYCTSSPSLDEALFRYGNLVYEYELEGLICIENGSVRVLS